MRGEIGRKTTNVVECLLSNYSLIRCASITALFVIIKWTWFKIKYFCPLHKLWKIAERSWKRNPKIVLDRPDLISQWFPSMYLWVWQWYSLQCKYDGEHSSRSFTWKFRDRLYEPSQKKWKGQKFASHAEIITLEYS